MPSRLKIDIRKTREELAIFAAGQLVEILSHAIKERKTASLVLSGGETPRRVYQLIGSPPLRSRLDWNRVHLFFGDERMVPPNHPDSNYGMARRELIERVPIPKENVHRIQGELAPENAVMEYVNELGSTYRGKIPRFDCMLLGIGEDGHTASLFPGTKALKEQDNIAVALFVPRLKAWRVTLTFPVINNAREVVFLAEGKRKASVVKKLIESAPPSMDLPAAMVHPRDGVLHWMLDLEAASLIR